MHIVSSRKQHHQRNGVVVVVTIVSLVTLVGFAALTTDVGYLMALAAETQKNADAAALAGVSAVKESLYDEYYARASAVLLNNHEAGGFPTQQNTTIQIGRWDEQTLQFTGLDPSNANSANAVRVVSVRPEAPLFLAAIFGKDHTSITREAVARVIPSCNGIWGLDSVDVPGSVYIDSYDSTAGAYSTGSALDNGDVCSNGEITVSGSADVNGDVLSATGDVTIIGGAAVVTGITEDAIDPVTSPTIHYGDLITNNDNGSIGLTTEGNDPLDNTHVSAPGLWDLVLTSNEILTLAPGTYIFDDITMTGQSSLVITGPTTIYLWDDLEMAGGTSFITTGNPADLTIISDGDPDGAHIKLSGNVEFYGAILAPRSEIVLSGTADYYGTVIAQELDFNGNFSFHVDESLELVNSLKGAVRLVK